MAFKVPAEITKAASGAGGVKCKLPIDKLLLLGFLAGAYIAFGALLSEIVAGGLAGGSLAFSDGTTAAIKLPSGLIKFAAGAVFPVGLMCVVIGGSELFTGNCMFAPLSVLNKEASWGGLAINWTIVYIGNFIGSIFLAYFLAYKCGLFNSIPWASWAATVANGKCGLDFTTAFFRGIGCNWLVCLAVWLALSADDVIGKIFSCWFPIMAFVTIGFEHCIANMFFIPLGIFVSTDATIAASLTNAGVAFGNISWYNFFVTNLIPVTLGNIVGGALFVGMIYWYLYLRQPAAAKAGAEAKAQPSK
ncbi:formate transporter [Methanocella sp. CWC-04]|uniref:Probable formate transporter n=1 Tax=Methanooceanicella nereidis TaxID=2052831 RepID=A0AAP2W431_9EURY|nr:formate/nitrite transporter family protein [Methanocella sp. CWC-04]MCD1293790.1 formate transporter [Methanocella sp. CWC-04]